MDVKLSVTTLAHERNTEFTTNAWRSATNPNVLSRPFSGEPLALDANLAMNSSLMLKRYAKGI